MTVKRKLEVISRIGKVQALVDKWKIRHHVARHEVRKNLPVEKRGIAHFDTRDGSRYIGEEKIDNIPPPAFNNSDGMRIWFEFNNWGYDRTR